MIDGDDDPIVRGVLTESVHLSEKSLEQIAEQMQETIGRRVTARMLKAWRDDSKSLHRFPLAFTRAFCEACGNWTLMRAVVERAGFGLMSPEEVSLAEIGRQYLAQKEAAQKLSQIETRFTAESRKPVESAAMGSRREKKA